MTGGAGGDRGYGTGARLFHWATVVMVLVLVLAGIAMTSDFFSPWADPLFILHKGLGTVLLVVVLLRLAWRLATPGPEHVLPAGAPAVERRLATWTHRALYALLLLQAGSGYLRVRAGGYPIELLDALGVPAFLPEMPALEPLLVVVHRGSAFLLVAVAAGHAAAAVQHHLVHGDGALRRMWPPVRPRAEAPARDGEG